MTRLKLEPACPGLSCDGDCAVHAAQPQADARVSGAWEDGYQAGQRAAYAEGANLERLARELCAAEYALRALGRQRYGGSPVDNGTMNDAKARRTVAIDALSQALDGRRG